mgnify:FL=1
MASEAKIAFVYSIVNFYVSMLLNETFWSDFQALFSSSSMIENTMILLSHFLKNMSTI